MIDGDARDGRMRHPFGSRQRVRRWAAELAHRVQTTHIPHDHGAILGTRHRDAESLMQRHGMNNMALTRNWRQPIKTNRACESDETNKDEAHLRFRDAGHGRRVAVQGTHKLERCAVSVARTCSSRSGCGLQAEQRENRAQR